MNPSKFKLIQSTSSQLSASSSRKLFTISHRPLTPAVTNLQQVSQQQHQQQQLRTICYANFSTRDNHWVKEDEKIKASDPATQIKEKSDPAPDSTPLQVDHDGEITEGLAMKKKKRRAAIRELEKYTSDLDSVSWMGFEIEEKINETVRNSLPSKRVSAKREKLEEKLKQVVVQATVLQEEQQQLGEQEEFNEKQEQSSQAATASS